MGQERINRSSVSETWLSFGVVGRAHGIKGWLHIHSSAEEPADILQYDTWRLTWPHGQVQEVTVEQGRAQGPQRVAAKFKGCDDRDAAKLFTGAQISIPRAELPELEEDDDFYLADLVGMEVVTKSGKALGHVERFFTNGAHDIVVLKTSEGKEALYPFVMDDTVEAILPDHRQIRMDWPDDH